MTRDVFCTTVCDRCHTQVSEHRDHTAIPRYWFVMTRQGDTVAGTERQWDLCPKCATDVDFVLRTPPADREARP